MIVLKAFKPTLQYPTAFDLPEGHPNHPHTLNECVFIGGPEDGSKHRVINQLDQVKFFPTDTMSTMHSPDDKVEYLVYRRMNLGYATHGKTKTPEHIKCNAFILEGFPEEGVRALGLAVYKYFQ